MLIRHAHAAGGADGTAVAEADAAACARIYSPFVRDTAVSLEEDPPDAAELMRRISEVTTRYPWLMAEEQGELIAFAYASPHRLRAAYRWAADVSVYVDPRHHRRGVARALYQRLLADLGAQGFHVACAGITVPNPASVALHESLGFQPVGVYRRIGYKCGAWRDVGWWQLPLAEPDGAPAEPRPRA